jgi:hypothetical protein
LNEESWLFKYFPAAICLAASVTACAQVDDFDFARVTSLIVAGTWAQGEQYGDVRLWSTELGFETIARQTFVDWVWIDPDTGRASILATQKIDACLGDGELSFVQGEFGAPLRIDVSGSNGATSLTIGAPGDVVMSACN